MGHKLNISVEDSTVNNKYIYVEDLSEWDEVLDIRYRRLQVHPPYLDNYIIVPFPNDKKLALSSVSMDLSKTLEDLPDGLYKIHYSVSPNDKVFIEYGHYRVAKLMNRVLSKMASLDFDCDNGIDQCGNVELDKQADTLLHIWMLLKGAQAVGKDCYKAEKAKDLYKQASREYDKLFDETCVGC